MKIQCSGEIAKERLLGQIVEQQELAKYITNLEETVKRQQEEIDGYKKFETHVFPVVSAHILTHGKLELTVDSAVLVDIDATFKIKNQSLVIESTDSLTRDQLKFIIRPEVDKSEKSAEAGEKPRT